MKLNKKVIFSSVVLSLSLPAWAVNLGDFEGTQVSIGGYIKAEGIFKRPDSGSNTFDGTARQSRFNISAKKEVEGHQLTAFVESDFYGGNATGTSYDLRLRHAYLKIDNVTVGQTWNGQFFALAPYDGETINFFGPGIGTIAGNGATVRRDLVINYRTPNLLLSAQDPVYTDADYPDVVAGYSHVFSTGSGVGIAATAREVEVGTDEGKLGAGISFAGRWMLGKNNIKANVFIGEGMGAYSGIYTSDAENGDLVSQTGFSIAYQQFFTDKLRGTLRYGQVNVDDTADTTMKMPSVNVIYTMLPGLEFGVEWRDQNIANHPARPAGQQVELMAKYKF